MKLLILTFLTQKKQRLELFFKMEAANLLKRQEASRKESMEMGNKIIDDMNSPSYDAELNAATASIISLPVDASSPIITTHSDVSFVTNDVLNVISSSVIPSSPTLRRPVNYISSMKSFRIISPMTSEGQPVKFSTGFVAMLKFKLCIRTSFNLTQSWIQVNLNKVLL